FQYFVDGRLVAIETRGELTVSDNDSHDVWRALNEPPSIADPLVETADRITSMLRRIFAKLEERSLS
ncbi:MAG TPA: hypothetical protein VHT21_17190, partial [Stellaceae bacterium]|nr:hypothetical protein [Stellaceae bacterium]